MRLFHFSDEPDIAVFMPRKVRVPVDRGAGLAWLNGPLVWAIDEAHAFLYLFPRECPRILVWATADTNAEDRSRWLGDSGGRAIAHIENDWRDRVSGGVIYRYELPTEPFEDIGDVGMWVSRIAVPPIGLKAIDDLPAALAALAIELRGVDSLTSLRDVWRTTLHASGMRLRNAAGWDDPGWPHSPRKSTPSATR